MNSNENKRRGLELLDVEVRELLDRASPSENFALKAFVFTEKGVLHIMYYRADTTARGVAAYVLRSPSSR